MVEVVNERGYHCKKNEVGELVVTNLDRTLMPIIRYRTGDNVKLLEITSDMRTKIKLVGRKSDSIKIGGELFVLPVSVVSDVLKDYASCNGNFQIVVSKALNRDNLSIHIESDCKESTFGVIESLAKKIYTLNPKIYQQIKLGVVNELEIKIVAEGSLIRSDASGKIKKVIDIRKELVSL